MFCFCLCADLEMAVAYWNLVLSGRFKFLDLWNRFLLVSHQCKIWDEPIKYVGLVYTQILTFIKQFRSWQQCEWLKYNFLINFSFKKSCVPALSYNHQAISVNFVEEDYDENEPFSRTKTKWKLDKKSDIMTKTVTKYNWHFSQQIKTRRKS